MTTPLESPACGPSAIDELARVDELPRGTDELRRAARSDELPGPEPDELPDRDDRNGRVRSTDPRDELARRITG
jgi:hypothetical protein